MTGLPWSLAVCPKCRGSLSPLAAPGTSAVHHTPGCPWRCRTVHEFVELAPGEYLLRFRPPASTAEPRHLGCRWCDQSLDRAIRRALRRRDFAAVAELAAWGRPESPCLCADCVERRGGVR